MASASTIALREYLGPCTCKKKCAHPCRKRPVQYAVNVAAPVRNKMFSFIEQWRPKWFGVDFDEPVIFTTNRKLRRSSK